MHKLSTKARKFYKQIRGKSQEPQGHDSPTIATALFGGRASSLPPRTPDTAGIDSVPALSIHSGPPGDGSIPVDNADTHISSPVPNIDITASPPAVAEGKGLDTRASPQPAAKLDIPSQSGQSVRRTAKNVLKGTLVVLSSGLEGLPIPAAKGIVDTIKKLITVFEATAANMELLEELDTRCQHLLEIVINPLKAKKESEISLEFREIIVRLESRLLELHSKVEGPPSGLITRMIDHEDITLDLKDVNDQITQYVDFFMLETHVLGLLSQAKLEKSVEKHALNQLIQSLPRAKAAFDSYLDASQTRSVCFTNTRQKLLGEIMAWMTSTDPTKPSIYILDGIAGIGKSTVAQTIAKRCAELGYLGASFFFSRSEDDRKSARLFFSSLAYGLASYSPEFAHSIQGVLEHTPNAAEKDLFQQIQYLLVDPLKGLFLKQPIILVIDALDE